jgi:hypothetical protein
MCFSIPVHLPIAGPREPLDEADILATEERLGNLMFLFSNLNRDREIENSHAGPGLL